MRLSFSLCLAALNVVPCLQDISEICVVLRLFAIFAMYFCFCLHVDLFCWILCRIVFSRCLEICKTLRDFCYFLRLRAMCLQQIASEPLLAERSCLKQLLGHS